MLETYKLFRTAWQRVLSFALILSLWINISCKEKSGQDPTIPKIPPLTDMIPYGKLGQGKLVFQRVGPPDNAYNGIYVVDANQQRAWGISEGDLNGPAVSPDGQKIAYSTTALTETAYDIYVMNIDGTNRKRISDINGQENNPCWTQDGSLVLFHAFRFDSDVDGLYTQSPVPNPPDRTLVIDFRKLNPSYDFWTQYGNISISSNNKIIISYKGIYTLDSDGSNLTRIIAGEENYPLYSAAFSPDGSKLALLAMKTDQYNIQSISVLVFSPDGTNPDTLVSMNASGNNTWMGCNSYSLCWSPDGSKIAFTRPDGPEVGSHIYIINTDKTDLTQVTFSAGVTDRSLSWGK